MSDAAARFLTPCRARFLEEWDGYRQKIALLEELRYASPLLGRELVVPAGFVSDRESRPTAGPITGPERTACGVLHDWLYASHVVEKVLADAIYREALAATGLDPVWVDQRYNAVAFYGDGAYESGPSRRRILAVAALVAGGAA
jgi:hypothetical protein